MAARAVHALSNKLVRRPFTDEYICQPPAAYVQATATGVSTIEQLVKQCLRCEVRRARRTPNAHFRKAKRRVHQRRACGLRCFTLVGHNDAFGATGVTYNNTIFESLTEHCPRCQPVHSYFVICRLDGRYRRRRG